MKILGLRKMWIMWKLWNIMTKLDKMRPLAIKKSTNFFRDFFEKICGFRGQLFSEEFFSYFYNVSGAHSYQQVALCTIF